MANINIVSQYTKDLSFEIPSAPEIFLKKQTKPDIEISINIDVAKISTELYEIILKIKATAKESQKNIFICEVAYAGLFKLQNIENKDLEQVLLVYCPNLLFPFIRKTIANLVIDGGFPTLMLDPIDFNALYLKRKKIANQEPINNTKN